MSVYKGGFIMERRYSGNDTTCKAAGRSLHYPDLDLLEKRMEVTTDKHWKKKDLRRKDSPKKKAERKSRMHLIPLLFIAMIFAFLFGSIGVHADPVETACNKDEIVYKVITVEKGDTLWDIADEWFKLTEDDIRTYIDNIKTMNHLQSDQIQEGQSLLIYYESSVKRLSDVASLLA